MLDICLSNKSFHCSLALVDLHLCMVDAFAKPFCNTNKGLIKFKPQAISEWHKPIQHGEYNFPYSHFESIIIILLVNAIACRSALIQ